MTEIQKIIKRIEKHTRYALPDDECDSAGKDWADGYNFALDWPSWDSVVYRENNK